MNNIIHKLTEYENDIKLLKNAIQVLETNFSKIKNDILENFNQENNHNRKKVVKQPKKINNKQNKKNVLKKK